MSLEDTLKDSVLGGTKRALFGGAKRKATITFRQIKTKDSSSAGVDKKGKPKVSQKDASVPITVEDSVTVVKAGGTGIPSVNLPVNVSTLTDSLGKLQSLAESAINTVGALTDDGNAKDASSVKPGPNGTDAEMETTSVKYTVMFNPESINIFAQGGGYVPKPNFLKAQDGDGEGTSSYNIEYQEDTNRIVTLSVQLVFDRVNQSDAFSVIDPFEYNLTGGTVKNIASSLTSCSVQRDVEGFLAAVRKNYTSMVTFEWGDMSYTGVITNVAAEYVMFNPKGDPIRAHVGLEMKLVDPSTSCSNYGVFDESRKEALKSDNPMSNYISWNTTANKVGSLIGL